MKFIVEACGDKVADEIKPSDIDNWIGAHDWSPATKDRYKNVFGKTFKIALADGKVTSNPAPAGGDREQQCGRQATAQLPESSGPQRTARVSGTRRNDHFLRARILRLRQVRWRYQGYPTPSTMVLAGRVPIFDWHDGSQ